MYGWLVKQLAERAIRPLSVGETSTLEMFIADDARFEFPGQHPFAADHDSKDEIKQWLRRFAHFQPQFQIHDVIATGWPWNIRVAAHFTDRIGGVDDPTPYVNEGMCLMRLRWGRIVEERVFLDTQAVAKFFGTETAEDFFGATNP